MWDEWLNSLNKLIDEAEIVSFDVFDTLLFRMEKMPEDVFALMEKNLGIIGFAQFRQESQRKASMELERDKGYPHANLDEIYGYMALHGERAGVDWKQIQDYEVQVELDSVFANGQMYQVYQYARQKKKRVIAVSDMYLQKKVIVQILEKCGYMFDAVYISADERKTKYGDGKLFKWVVQQEKAQPSQILHIGDNYKSDVENARKQGLNSIHYQKTENDVTSHVPSFLGGIANALCGGKENFWYRLGAALGGPLYLELYLWLKKIQEAGNYDKIFFLARDGYVLYEIYRSMPFVSSTMDIQPLQKGMGEEKAEYFYFSRRALLLAGIEQLDESALELLPPHTLGQSLQDVFDYLGVTDICGGSIGREGYKSLRDVIKSREDWKKIKNIFKYNEKAFLERCKEERKNVLAYLKKTGFMDSRALIFDCGWNGSSQYFLKRFLKTVKYEKEYQFAYVGICDSVKSRKQLKGLNYSTYLFDCDKNRDMQEQVMHAVVLFELFFSAPHESVWYFDQKGPVLEPDGDYNHESQELTAGIKDFVIKSKPFVEKYGIKIDKKEAVAGIVRLVNAPTLEEAVIIGNLRNVDGFVKAKRDVKYIAKIPLKAYLKNPQTEVYWLEGLLKRQDVNEFVKWRVAGKNGVDYLEYKRRQRKKDDWEETIVDLKQIKRKYGKKGYALVKGQMEREAQDTYSQWIKENETGQEFTERLEYSPLISVVIPVYNVEEVQLRECIESVEAQIYENWELCLVDDASTWPSVGEVLKEYEGKEKIHIRFRKENGHISRATNDGIAMASGEFIAFSDCDDVLAPNALYEMVKLLNVNPAYDFIYSDEDKLTEDGKQRHSPFFKPDWSPDTFMELMYTNHLAIYRRSLVERTGGLRSEFNGAQDYDFTLRFMEYSDNSKVGHVSKVLYHWRERGESIASNPEAKPYALEAMKKAKEEALFRRGLSGEVRYIPDMYQYRVVYHPKENPLVSVIIPSKDNVEVLKRCILSIKEYTEYTNYEIVVVDNGSSEENKARIEEICRQQVCRYLYKKQSFNFSAMCNQGAAAASGEYLLFLNDDTEVCSKDWMEILTGQASLKHVGAVGAKLLYPKSHNIQHAGITNLEIGPSHALLKADDRIIHYFGRNRIDYNYLAVTGACLMVAKDKFEKVRGYEEKLPIAYNDIDLCFKLYENGFYNVIRNDVVLYHYESFSRGSDDKDKEKQKRLQEERRSLYERHPALEGRDPFYNVNLMGNGVEFGLRVKKKANLGKLEPFDASRIVVGGDIHFFIDQFTPDEILHVHGWAYERNGRHAPYTKVSLAFLGNGEYSYEVETEQVFRMDIARAQRRLKGTPFSGFQCDVDTAQLNLQNNEYKIGFVLDGGKKKRRRIIILDYELTGGGGEIEKDRLFLWKGQAEMPDGIKANIDSVSISETVLVSGWAFLPGCEGNHLWERAVVLKDERGQIWEARTDWKARPDLAALYGMGNSLMGSGFSCEILADVLKQYGNCFQIGIVMRHKETGEKRLHWTEWDGRQLCF